MLKIPRVFRAIWRIDTGVRQLTGAFCFPANQFQAGSRCLRASRHRSGTLSQHYAVPDALTYIAALSGAEAPPLLMSSMKRGAELSPAATLRKAPRLLISLVS